ncbi:response regulator [Pseudoalteromonas ostreae]|uniref:response regulator n=1 Tax=Pseudoalteromonas ostreae TaxID=2774154 RepID=UPI001B3954B6|nr:response regulator [Pseudoalteromonas ostreae]
MSKEIEHVERHPKVILLCDKVEDLSGVAELISSQVDAFRTLNHFEEIQKILVDSLPLVIIIAMSNVKRSIELYSKLAKQSLLDYPHENILLCENKESGIAFRCCMKGIFNDYFVYKPMYENYRLRMILNNALVNSKKNNDIKNLTDEHFGHIDADVKQLLDDAAQYQNSTKQKLHSVRSDLAKQQGINEAQTALIDELREKYIAPLLNELESQLNSSVTELIDKLKDKQHSLSHTSELLKQSTAPNHRNLAPPLNEINLEPSQEQPLQKIQSKIMVVEDNDIYRNIIGQILIDEGYHVNCVATGLEAIKILRKEKYDLVFMDLFMPDLDGYNTTRNIRNIPNCKEVPIIALTSNKNKDLIKKWASLGLAAYITKPSTKLSILKAIEKCS